MHAPATMFHTNSGPSYVHESPVTTGQETLTGGKRPKEAGGVELVEISRATKERRGADQPAKSMCFLTENCEWCSPDVQVESHPTNTVEALKQCLSTLDREREAADMRRSRFLALMARFLDRDGQVA